MDFSRMSMVSGLLIVAIWSGSVTFSAASEKNTTIPCVFDNIRHCYINITEFGSMVNAHFADNVTVLNNSCNDNVSKKVKGCLQVVANTCKAKLSDEFKKVENLVADICTNNDTKNEFVNASKNCFNKNVKIGRDCTDKYATTKKDAKALCCSRYKIIKCVEDKFKKVSCSKNDIKFYNRLLDTYNDFVDPICKKYSKKCSGVLASPLTSWIIVLATAVVFITKDKLS